MLQRPLTLSAPHLVWQHHLAVLHVFEDIIGRVQGANLGALRSNKGGQVDEPEAVTVTQQALGPHVRDSRVLLSSFLGQLDLLGGGHRINTFHNVDVLDFVCEKNVLNTVFNLIYFLILVLFNRFELFYIYI